MSKLDRFVFGVSLCPGNFMQEERFNCVVFICEICVVVVLDVMNIYSE